MRRAQDYDWVTLFAGNWPPRLITESVASSSFPKMATYLSIASPPQGVDPHSLSWVCCQSTFDNFSNGSVHRSAFLLAACLSLVAQSGAFGQSGQRVPRKKPFAEFSESAERLRGSVASKLSSATSTLSVPILQPTSLKRESELRDSIVALARSQIGSRYRWGAQSPGNAFDCSGLVKFVLSALHLDLPRTARSQSLVGRPVERDTAQLRPGDLLTFGRGTSVTHIGIYVGDGRIVHASTGKHHVVEADMSDSWFKRHWLGVRRLVASADTAS